MSKGAIDRELIYLDHAATTPMRPEAIAAMQPFLADVYANPSGSHRFAREARRAIDEARDAVAAVVGCKPGEVIFNGGGTEGDNTAIFGAVRRIQATGGAAAAVCSAAEHHAVLHCVEHLTPHGAGWSSVRMAKAASMSLRWPMCCVVCRQRERCRSSP